MRATDFAGPRLDCTLADLGTVEVRLVSGRAGSRSWRAAMEGLHPQGDALLPGGVLRYEVVSSRFGLLGLLSFASASWHVKARDEYIGWGPKAAAANLGLVVNQARFLIMPGVRVPNLASHSLALACRRVCDDWEKQSGVRPVLAYTYVDLTYSGDCYAGAGWRRVGETSGRPPGSGGAGRKRAVWAKPLCADWRKRLRQEPKRTPGSGASLTAREIDDWAVREYCRSPLVDGRLRRRQVAMGRTWENKLGEMIPIIFPDAAARIAAYRFLSNPEVTMDDILAPHLERTIEDCRLESAVLVVQDTTTLNYDTCRNSMSGLVELGGGGKGVKGLFVHASVAFTLAGRPLGVVALDGTTRKPGKVSARREREPDGKESKRWLAGFDRAVELANACPETRVVNVCDREADIFELMRRQRDTGVGLLFRASKGRRRRVVLADGRTTELWDHLAEQPVLQERALEITARGGKQPRAKRRALLHIRAAQVHLAPPRNDPEPSPVTMTAILVSEAKPRENPLEWMLLCSEPVNNKQQALEIVRWYEKRWSIEEYFRILKNGTRIEDRKLESSHALLNCLAFDAITACRVFALSRLAREHGNSPASSYVVQVEIDALYIAHHRQGIAKERGPPADLSIRTFVIDVARLAGFRPRKQQPLPGNQKLWEGYALLKSYALMRPIDWDDIHAAVDTAEDLGELGHMLKIASKRFEELKARQ